MDKYLSIVVVFLLLVIIDQAHALKELSELNRTYESSMNDYWDALKKCK